MQYTNSHILSAVLARWSKPLITQVIESRLSSIPLLGNLEAKIKSTGWVGRGWTLSSDLSPLLGGMSEKMLTPIFDAYISKLPQDSLPAMAHELVDNALTKGGLTVLDGAITLDASDLRELKNLLNYNLPIAKGEIYKVKEAVSAKEEL